MQIPFIDLYRQYLTIKSEIDQAIAAVIQESAYIGGKYCQAFEKAFAEYLGVKHCIGVANGTEALTISLKMLGIGPGDEVITVANTFIATAEAITNAGASVVFVDNEPDYYTIDVKALESKISTKTKAIIPVHLHGHPANMDEILKIARKYNLFVIEDAAQAHGAEYHQVRIGNFGIAATFSFYPGKNLGAYGDGGAIVTNNDELAVKVRMYANHGRVAKYDHQFEGVNSRLDGLQAAILTVKLRHLEEWIATRRQIAALYRQHLQDVNQVVLPKEQPGVRHVYHLFVIRAQRRDELRAFLTAKGIGTGIHYPIALPNLQAYAYLKHKPEDFPIATRYQAEQLSLPIYPELSEDQIAYICEQIRQFYRQK